MSRFVKVKDHPDLVRDTVTGAILNNNKEKIRETKSRLNQEKRFETEINNLKSDVSDIKQMLSKLLELSKNG